MGQGVREGQRLIRRLCGGETDQAVLSQQQPRPLVGVEQAGAQLFQGLGVPAVGDLGHIGLEADRLDEGGVPQGAHEPLGQGLHQATGQRDADQAGLDDARQGGAASEFQVQIDEVGLRIPGGAQG